MITAAWEINLDLWGASPAWVESIADGIGRILDDADHKARVTTTICPAYAGVQVTVYDELLAHRILRYGKRCKNLALAAA